MGNCCDYAVFSGPSIAALEKQVNAAINNMKRSIKKIDDKWDEQVKAHDEFMRLPLLSRLFKRAPDIDGSPRYFERPALKFHLEKVLTIHRMINENCSEIRLSADTYDTITSWSGGK